MASAIMKKAIANHKKSIQQDAPHRSSVLSGIQHVERWLREEIAASKFGISDRTAVDYVKKAARLRAIRPRAGEPPDINALTNKASTFYAYRAALRYDACLRGTSAIRAYNKALKEKNATAKNAAYAALLEAAADLKAYPRDEQPGLPNRVHVKLGLANEKQKSSFRKDPLKAVPKRNTSKLKAANRIQQVEKWREKIFARLTEIKSPWIIFAAVAALTGARPEELHGIIIERRDDMLRFSIEGAKVGEHSGQACRWLTVRDDGPEFRYLWNIAAVPYTVEAPNLKNYKDAFSAALARAGAQAFPNGTPRMSAYVYRHALISDLKADGCESEAISAVLGHAATRTAAHYGRAIGGKKGCRQVDAKTSRPIKQNHTSFNNEPTQNWVPI